MSLFTPRFWKAMATLTPLLYSSTLLNQAYAILVNFPRPSNGFAYPLHFAALFVLSGASTLLSIPIGLPFTRPTSSLQPIGNALMALSTTLFVWTTWTTQRGRLSAIFGGETPGFIIDSGPFAFVRHPAYTAYLLGWTGAVTALSARNTEPWRVPALAACIVGLAGVFRAGALMEEDQILSEDEGEKAQVRKEYKDYMSKVKYRWLPGLV